MSAVSPLEQGSLDEVRAFLEQEARLLDERRFGDWVALFEPDGWYWAPAQPRQESPDTALSLIYEDRRLLEVRARRLDNPSAHADTPPERSHRHLSGIDARAGADGLVEAGSMLLLLAWRDGVQSCFSARCQHRLRPVAGGLRIVSKRVELLNCDAPLRRITAPF